MTLKTDCLFIGMITKDLLLFVDEPPQSDKRILMTESLTATGGPAYTAAVACAELGSRTAFVTVTGNDENGQEVLSKAKQIPFSEIQATQITNGRTPFSAVLIEPNGKRLIASNPGCIDQLTAETLHCETLCEAKIIHLGGLYPEHVPSITAFCKQNSDAIISLDGGNFSQQILDDSAKFLNVLILDDKTVMKSYGFAPKEACYHFSKLGIQIVGVTLGEQGALFFAGDQFLFGTALKVESVDTTGAGDNFHGAFVHCLNNSMSLEECIRFSNAYAGLCCEGYGGHPRRIELSEICERMKEVEITYPDY